MNNKQPKQTFSIIGLLLFIVIAASCNNSADNAKTATDSTSKMEAQPAASDTAKKVDTTKMDTATTRPVKSPN